MTSMALAQMGFGSVMTLRLPSKSVALTATRCRRPDPPIPPAPPRPTCALAMLRRGPTRPHLLSPPAVQRGRVAEAKFLRTLSPPNLNLNMATKMPACRWWVTCSSRAPPFLRQVTTLGTSTRLCRSGDWSRPGRAAIPAKTGHCCWDGWRAMQLRSRPLVAATSMALRHFPANLPESAWSARVDGAVRICRRCGLSLPFFRARAGGGQPAPGPGGRHDDGVWSGCPSRALRYIGFVLRIIALPSPTIAP
jgi:hypothetical protein